MTVTKLMLGITLAAFLGACSSSGSTSGEDNNPVVVTTTTIIADVAGEIAGDRLEVKTIMPIGGDPHIYRPVPGDARMIARSDLVILNGMELEGWLDQLARNAGGERPMVVATDGIDALRDPEYHDEPDPHAWFDVRHMKTYVDNIVEGFLKIDPEGEEYFTERAETYKAQLDELHEWVHKQVQTLPEERRVLITSHDAFQYYGQAYDIEVIGVQGISTEAEPQTRDVINIINLINDREIPSVFMETSVNPKMIEQIAEETGVRIGGELFSDSVGPPDHEGGTYIGMIRYNTRTFVDAMQEPLVE